MNVYSKASILLFSSFLSNVTHDSYNLQPLKHYFMDSNESIASRDISIFVRTPALLFGVLAMKFVAKCRMNMSSE